MTLQEEKKKHCHQSILYRSVHNTPFSWLHTHWLVGTISLWVFYRRLWKGAFVQNHKTFGDKFKNHWKGITESFPCFWVVYVFFGHHYRSLTAAGGWSDRSLWSRFLLEVNIRQQWNHFSSLLIHLSLYSSLFNLALIPAPNANSQ